MGFSLFLYFFAAASPVTEAPTDNAQRCDPAECELPYCYCSKDGTNIPKDLNPEDVSWNVNYTESEKGWKLTRKKIIKRKGFKN